MSHSVVQDVVSKIDSAMDIALGVAKTRLSGDEEIKAANTTIGACNSVSRLAGQNVRTRLAAPKLQEIEAATNTA